MLAQARTGVLIGTVLVLLVAVVQLPQAQGQVGTVCPASYTATEDWELEERGSLEREASVVRLDCRYAVSKGSGFGSVESDGTAGASLTTGGGEPTGIGYVDDDGNDRIGPDDWVYLASDPSGQVAGNDVRVISPHGEPGSMVGGSSNEDFGAPLKAATGSFGYVDDDGTNSFTGNDDDTLIYDSDGDGSVSVNDIQFSGADAGSLVDSNHHLFNRALVDYDGTLSFEDNDGDNSFDAGDELYFDSDSGGSVNAQDIRLTGGGDAARQLVFTLTWEYPDQALGEVGCGDDPGDDGRASSAHHAQVTWAAPPGTEEPISSPNSLAAELIEAMEAFAAECSQTPAAPSCPEQHTFTDGTQAELSSSQPGEDAGQQTLRCAYASTTSSQAEEWEVRIAWTETPGPETERGCLAVSLEERALSHDDAEAYVSWGGSSADPAGVRAFSQARLMEAANAAIECIQVTDCQQIAEALSNAVLVRAVGPYTVDAQGTPAQEIACSYADSDRQRPEATFRLTWVQTDGPMYWACQEGAETPAQTVASEVKAASVAWTTPFGEEDPAYEDHARTLLSSAEARAAGCPSEDEDGDDGPGLDPPDGEAEPPEDDADEDAGDQGDDADPGTDDAAGVHVLIVILTLAGGALTTRAGSKR